MKHIIINLLAGGKEIVLHKAIIKAENADKEWAWLHNHFNAVGWSEEEHTDKRTVFHGYPIFCNVDVKELHLTATITETKN